MEQEEFFEEELYYKEFIKVKLLGLKFLICNLIKILTYKMLLYFIN